MSSTNVTAGKPFDQTMSVAEFKKLLETVRARNTVDSPAYVNGTPRVRVVVPFYDVETMRISKVEIQHGPLKKVKNFEVQYTPGLKTIFEFILEWLETKMVPRALARLEQDRQHDRMTPQQRKLHSPENPFYTQEA